jgi:hypothetical protein
LTDKYPRYDPAPLVVDGFMLEDLIGGDAPSDPVEEATIVHQAVSRVLELLSDRRSVMVHCQGGRGRTGTVVGGALVRLGHAPSTVTRWLDELHRGRHRDVGQNRAGNGPCLRTSVIDNSDFITLRQLTCKQRSPHELSEGLTLLGKRLVRATELSWLLSSSEGGLVQGTRARETVMAAMLTWERSLVEFVLSPVEKWKPDGHPKYTLGTTWLRQNLCPWCFGIPWRLEDDDPELHKLIRDRWNSISRHVAHASWKEATSPRVFNVDKIVNVVGALDRFTGALGAAVDRERLAVQLANQNQRAKGSRRV